MFDPIVKLLGHDLRSTLAADAIAHGLGCGEPEVEPVTEADLVGLPKAARRYLRFMGVVGRPRDRSFRARFRGRFRMRPGQGFMPFDAWQYNTRFPVARLFHMRVDFAGLVPMVGRDAYLGGLGRMRGKLLGLLPVADGSGVEFDVSELATWLDDAIILSPSMLLDPATTWSEIDDDAFAVAFTDIGLRVEARVLVDRRGAPLVFSTTDRYAALPSGPLRAEWTTPVARWDVVAGRQLPGPSAAIWHLPEGPFTYVEGAVVSSSVEYDVAPDGTPLTTREHVADVLTLSGRTAS
ncbi:MAG TPA: DUF6544 family protein [Acidimicrobiia bacterium]